MRKITLCDKCPEKEACQAASACIRKYIAEKFNKPIEQVDTDEELTADEDEDNLTETLFGVNY